MALPVVGLAADVYVSTGTNGTPIYTSQPLDPSYSLVMRGGGSEKAGRNVSESAKLGSTKARAFYDGLEPLIQEIATRHGLEPALVRAIAHVESRFNPLAVSPKGATGVMQLMPDTAKRYGVSNRGDAAQSLDAGTRYLKDLLARYNGNVALALSAYNAGEGSVDRHAKKVPPYRETMLYVPEVLTKYEAYKQAEGSAQR